MQEHQCILSLTLKVCTELYQRNETTIVQKTVPHLGYNDTVVVGKVVQHFSHKSLVAVHLG